MPRVFSKQKRPTLMNQALEQIREAIVSGKLKPGDRLVETTLAKQMQISRFPIREALRYLEKEGLVASEPFKGTYVAELTEADLQEVYSLRGAIEEMALTMLMETLNAKKISKLESIVVAMEKAAKDKDLDKLIFEDLRFHQTICELSGHKRLLNVWSTLENQLRIFLGIEEDLYEDSERYVMSHLPLLEAIKSGKKRLAKKTIREHLAQGMELIKQSYWDGEPSPEPQGMKEKTT